MKCFGIAMTAHFSITKWGLHSFADIDQWVFSPSRETWFLQDSISNHHKIVLDGLELRRILLPRGSLADHLRQLILAQWFFFLELVMNRLVINKRFEERIGACRDLLLNLFQNISWDHWFWVKMIQLDSRDLWLNGRGSFMKKGFYFRKIWEVKKLAPTKKKRLVGINLSPVVIDCFKTLPEESEIPCQKINDLYLLGWIKRKRKLSMKLSA